MGKVRGIRFTAEEENQIERFLKSNPLIDFSTVARIAILEFIKNPKINLIPVRPAAAKEKSHARSN